MQMYKLEVYVKDFNNFGIKDVINALSSSQAAQYPKVFAISSTDIGTWNDNHELNLRETSVETYRKYFTEEAT